MLTSSSPAITVSQIVQEANRFVMFDPNIYHSGFNMGYNVAKATNFTDNFLVGDQKGCGKIQRNQSSVYAMHASSENNFMEGCMMLDFKNQKETRIESFWLWNGTSKINPFKFFSVGSEDRKEFKFCLERPRSICEHEWWDGRPEKLSLFWV